MNYAFVRIRALEAAAIQMPFCGAATRVVWDAGESTAQHCEKGGGSGTHRGGLVHTRRRRQGPSRLRCGGSKPNRTGPRARSTTASDVWVRRLEVRLKESPAWRHQWTRSTSEWVEHRLSTSS